MTQNKYPSNDSFADFPEIKDISPPKSFFYSLLGVLKWKGYPEDLARTISKLIVIHKNPSRKAEDVLQEIAESPREHAIVSFFPWHGTPEGEAFWRGKVDEYQELYLKMVQWNEHWVVPQPGGMLIATSFTFAKNIRSRLGKPAVLAGTVVTSFLLDSLQAETDQNEFQVYRNEEPEKMLTLRLDTPS